MQKIKILIFIVLLSIGFSFNGELYMLYLDNFQESYYQAGFYPERSSEESTNDQIKKDFLNAGKNNNVDFFVIDRVIQSAFETDITIYGTEQALDNLQLQNIKEGKNESLFFGEATVHYNLFEKTKNISKYNTYYLIGDEDKKESFDSFKAELIDQYGGGFPKLTGSNQETRLNLLSVWGIIFCLSLMMTLYGVIYQKKETMIRIVLGENLNYIFIKNIMTDTAFFVILFLSIPKFLRGFSNVYFYFSFIVLLFVLFVFINILLQAMILHVHFKKDLADGNSGTSFLSANYVLKVITTILTILILASNVVIIKDAYNLYQQRDFFEIHKNYSYYQSNYKVNNQLGKNYIDDIAMNQQFYQRFQDRSLQYVDLTENFGSTYPVLLNNKESMEENTRIYPTIANAIQKATEDKVYLLLPSNLSYDSQEHNIAMEIGNAFFSNAGYGRIETIVYDKGISLVGVHRFNDYKMKQYKDPIIVYNNSIFQANESQAGYDLYYAYDTMYDISPESWQAFVQEFQLEDQIIAKSSVLDVYHHSWSLVDRNLKLTLILSAFLLSLEMTLIIFIIRLEYQFNAIERALRKIHGYSLFGRNKKMFVVTIFSSFAGILIALILSSALKIQGGYPLILVGLLLLTLELCYILRKIIITERLTMASILKGEKI